MTTAQSGSGGRLDTDHGTASDEIIVAVVNGVGLITLNRPKALNALSYRMLRLLGDQLSAWQHEDGVRAVVLRGAGDRAFCAGGDVRVVCQSFRDKTPLHRQFFIDEYRLDYLLHRYPKPVVALMDRIVMGGGMGLAQAAAWRLVTERSRIAMPETGIGMLPDVGASHFLSKMPAPLALYLGITGVTLSAADTLLCGLADEGISTQELEDVEGILARVRWRDAESPLAAMQQAYGHDSAVTIEGATLTAVLPAIYRHFNPSKRVGVIVAALARETDVRYAAWAQATLELLASRSPTMMEVTRALLLRGRRMDLADCFRMEQHAVMQTFVQGDFLEGVRALLVDKDRSPRWKPERLEAVDDAEVARFFASPTVAASSPLREMAWQ
jgi:enoyl-CoA hydratase/carnithine racemase